MTATLLPLIESLRSDQPAERQSAAEQLLHLGPDAAPAAVALVEAADSDDETRNLATAALEDLGAPAADTVAALSAILERRTLDGPYWAATLLGRLESDAAPAVKRLTSAAQDHPHGAVRQRAVWALGRIGPPAAAAVPTLEEIQAGRDQRLAALARDALAKIQS